MDLLFFQNLNYALFFVRNISVIIFFWAQSTCGRQLLKLQLLWPWKTESKISKDALVDYLISFLMISIYYSKLCFCNENLFYVTISKGV